MDTRCPWGRSVSGCEITVSTIFFYSLILSSESSFGSAVVIDQCMDDGLDSRQDRSLYGSGGEAPLLSQRDIGYIFSKPMRQELWHTRFSSNVPSGT